jgi:predicted phage replisome organizer
LTDVKWIKIYTGMVSNKKIKRIRTLPEGNNIVLIWVFLLAQAGECNKNGALYLTDTIPFRPEDLAVEFGFEITVINLALITLERFSMIEVFDEVIYIKNWSEYQNIDGLEKIKEQTRIRVSNHREKQKQLAGVVICQYCGSSATGIDHVIATARGGSNSDDNKVPCCIECNRIKNDKPLIDFLNSNRGRIVDNLVVSSPILSRYVTLCNVTDRYTVTQCNAIELELELELDKEKKKVSLDDFFDSVWKIYPKKEGKGGVSKTQKEKLFKIGIDEMTRAVNRYIKAKSDTDKKFWKNGSTFFNSGYVDYLDANYHDDTPNREGMIAW